MANAVIWWSVILAGIYWCTDVTLCWVFAATIRTWFLSSAKVFSVGFPKSNSITFIQHSPFCTNVQQLQRQNLSQWSQNISILIVLTAASVSRNAILMKLILFNACLSWKKRSCMFSLLLCYCLICIQLNIGITHMCMQQILALFLSFTEHKYLRTEIEKYQC